MAFATEREQMAQWDQAEGASESPSEWTLRGRAFCNEIHGQLTACYFSWSSHLQFRPIRLRFPHPFTYQ